MDDTGPLAGVRVVELAGIGPGPFAVMLLADMGAEVIRVDRAGPASADYTPNPVIERGRRSIAVDLKNPAGVEVVLRLVESADVLVESYRPGVAERLGVGPQPCLARNPRLVYGRMTGWGQDGELAPVAGHDINYISMTGALHAMGRAGERPVPPLNLVGDFGGGASSLAFGVVCALLKARSSGLGQVVDANVLDATSTLMGLVHGLRAAGKWTLDRGANLLDTGCPYYDVYTCGDGRWVAVGAIEERFFQNVLTVLGLDHDEELRGSHKDRSRWPALRTALAAAFATRTRDEWTDAFTGVDSCVTPVLDMDEAATHRHAKQRGAYQPIPGSAMRQPAVAPRLSRSRTPVPGAPPVPGEHTREILTEAGLGDRLGELLESGAVADQA
jgi:alpha-methylacyl-CoA racemase